MGNEKKAENQKFTNIKNLEKQRRKMIPVTLFSTQDVTKEDGKKYSCTASNSQGEKATGHIILRPIEPPKISPFTFDGDLKEGDRSQVNCILRDYHYQGFSGIIMDYRDLLGHGVQNPRSRGMNFLIYPYRNFDKVLSKKFKP